MLGQRPAASYSFAASEAHRRYGFEVDRATVRRWAKQQGLAHRSAQRKRPASVRRWQCSQIGALWQLDASPHRWFGSEKPMCSLLEIIDDCSRMVTGARLYARENLLAYYDLLPRAFLAYSLPVALYVDYHSFFFNVLPDALTDLGWARKYFGISFRYAPTPQAKGKIERLHQYWQNRLPGYLAMEQIEELSQANEHLDLLRTHHNEHETHRELRCTPHAAWDQALAERRTQLQPIPRTPWWPYIWSMRAIVRVGPDGCAPGRAIRVKLATGYRMPNMRLMHCTHPDGSISLLANTHPVGQPILLYRLEG